MIDNSGGRMRWLPDMVRRLLNGPVLMTWYSLSVRMGKGLLILPVAAIVLEPADLALWLLLLVVIEAAQQAEMGLGPTLLRATAYFLAGADTLNAISIDTVRTDEVVRRDRQPNLKALGQLVSTGQMIYHGICALVLPLISTVAVYASWGFLEVASFRLDLWLAIAAAVLLVLIRLQSVFWYSILQGFGRVADCNRVDGSINTIITVFQIVTLLLGFGVLGLLVAQIIGWLVLYAWIVRMCKTELAEHRVETAGRKIAPEIMHQLWPLTWRLGVTMLGSFLLANGPSFFTGHLASAEIAVGYLLSMRILTINRGLAGAFLLAEMPKAVRMSARQELGPLRNFTAKRIAASGGIFLLGFILVLALGNPLLALVGAKTRFLTMVPFLLLGLSSLLISHMADHLLIFVTSNRIPFWRLFMAAGTVTVILTAILVPIYDLWALIGVRLAITVLTVGWYPVLLNLRYLNWRWRDYCRDIPSAGFGLVRSKATALFR